MTGNRYSVIGLGAVGRTIAIRLQETGWKAEWLIGRARTADRSLSRSLGGKFGTELSELAQTSGLIIIAVPTSRLKSVARELAKLKLNWKQLTFLHCAGSLGMEPLRPLAAKGAAVAACHPYQTFPRTPLRTITVDLHGTSFGITGNPSGVSGARKMVRALGGVPHIITEKSRLAYHASAVIACSQVASDVSAAVRILNSLGLSERDAERAAVAIASETVRNIRELGLKAALTGPAVRGDLKLIRKQTAALYKIDPDISQAYGLISRWVMKRLGKVQRPESKRKRSRP